MQMYFCDWPVSQKSMYKCTFLLHVHVEQKLSTLHLTSSRWLTTRYPSVSVVLEYGCRICDLHGELDAELGEVFAGGSEVVADDRDVALQVRRDGRDVAALVAD